MALNIQMYGLKDFHYRDGNKNYKITGNRDLMFHPFIGTIAWASDVDGDLEI